MRAQAHPVRTTWILQVSIKETEAAILPLDVVEGMRAPRSALVFPLTSVRAADRQDEVQAILLALDRKGLVEVVGMQIMEVAETTNVPIAYWREQETERLAEERALHDWVMKGPGADLIKRWMDKADAS